MLSLLLLYWVAKKYYDLANVHGRSKLKYTFLAIIIYYGTIFTIGGIVYVFLPDYEDIIGSSFNSLILLSGMVIGLGFWYLVYEYLDKKWLLEKKNGQNNLDSIQEV